MISQKKSNLKFHLSICNGNWFLKDYETSIEDELASRPREYVVPSQTNVKQSAFELYIFIMRKKFIILTLLVFNYECNGGILRGFLDGALDVHKQVHGAASAVLDSISHGLNLQGHFGINAQHNHESQPEKPTDTLIVNVNEYTNNEGPFGNQNRPPYQNRPQDYNPQENYIHQNANWNNNNPNNFGQPNPPYYVNNNRPQNNQGQYNRPGFGNSNQNNFRPPNNPGYENQNQNNYGNPNYGSNYQPGYENQNQNNFGQQNKPNVNQNAVPNQPGFDNSNINNGQVNTPEDGKYNQNNNVWSNPTEANDIQHTTEKVVGNENNKPNKDDEPLFVPLNPNEYIYGGDKIHVESPKRDTEVKPKPAEEDEELFPIDVRFKKE